MIGIIPYKSGLPRQDFYSFNIKKTESYFTILLAYHFIKEVKGFKSTKKKNLTMSQESNLLNTSWTLYFHDPDESSWHEDSYKVCARLHTIEDFWKHYGNLPKTTLHYGMFFLMRSDIKPLWEDPNNKNGGCWTFKVSSSDVFEAWKTVSARLISETLITDTSHLTGLSLSPKKGEFAIIKIWNSKSSIGSAMSNLSLNDVPLLNGAKSLYTPFATKDKKKQQFI